MEPATIAPSELEEHLVYEDDRGHCMPYLLRPAADPPASRTLVILHGHGSNKRFAKFTSRDWNILCPFDRYGRGNHGTWWLGESGDDFVAAMLHGLIARVRAEIGGDQGLYFYGSSMGGYGAILHGLLLGAHAIYANIPQIRLRGTTYTDVTSQRNFVQLVGPERHPYEDLVELMRGYQPRESPVFFIGQNRFDELDYLEQHCFYFINACNALGFNYHLEIHPLAGHTKPKTVAQSVALFDVYREAIEEWHAVRTNDPPTVRSDCPTRR